MESGWDPEVKKYFRKILNSISMGLIWMMSMVTAGIYFQLAYSDGRPVIYTILFYIVLLVTLAMLIFYFYKTWRK